MAPCSLMGVSFSAVHRHHNADVFDYAPLCDVVSTSSCGSSTSRCISLLHALISTLSSYCAGNTAADVGVATGGNYRPCRCVAGAEAYLLTAVSTHSNLMTQITEYNSARKPTVESQLVKPMCTQITQMS